MQKLKKNKNGLSRTPPSLPAVYREGTKRAKKKRKKNQQIFQMRKWGWKAAMWFWISYFRKLNFTRNCNWRRGKWPVGVKHFHCISAFPFELVLCWPSNFFVWDQNLLPKRKALQKTSTARWPGVALSTQGRICTVCGRRSLQEAVLDIHSRALYFSRVNRGTAKTRMRSKIMLKKHKINFQDKTFEH